TGKVKVTDSDAERVLSAKNILIATGSEPMSLPGVVVNEDNVVSSSGALSLSKVPEHLVVIGAGYIGLEMASVWRRLGAEVTVVEFLDRITPNMDAETSAVLQQSLEKQGIKFLLNTRVVGTAERDSETIVSLEPKNGSRVEEIGCEVVLLAIGRQPFTTGLGLEEVGVRVSARGFIEVDDKFETSVSGIFAIGDVIPGPMLAHKAEEEAVVAVEMMVGQSGHVNYKCIPSVIYTAPEVASVGLSEEELKASGIGYRSGKFPFLANSRARSSGLDQVGFVKILVDEKVDTIVGAHIIGPDAGTLIAELALAMEFSASAEDVARTCHAHPTLNEAIKEAALAAYSQPIHL
ncbi:MAG: FAD-dependent oxidoreductase, partial [Rhodospirillaceae bacterium]